MTRRRFDRASQHSLTPHRPIRTKLTGFDQMNQTPTLDPYLKIRMPPVEWLEERIYWSESCIYKYIRQRNEERHES